MSRALIISCAAAALWSGPSWAADLPACLDRPTSALSKANYNASELSPLTQQTRDRLIRSPGDIGAVIAEANAAADILTRAQIELGIVEATRYLKRYDFPGYVAIDNYFLAHRDDPVVADIQSALCARAAAPPTGAPPTGAPPAGAPAAVPGGPSGGGFSSDPGASVSPQ